MDYRQFAVDLIWLKYVKRALLLCLKWHLSEGIVVPSKLITFLVAFYFPPNCHRNMHIYFRFCCARNETIDRYECFI